MARIFGYLEIRYVREVMDSGRLGRREGGMVSRLEEAFAERVGVKFGIARSSAMTGLAQAVSVSGVAAESNPSDGKIEMIEHLLGKFN